MAIFTLESFTWIYILHVKINTIPCFDAVTKKWWLKNFGSADWFFKISLSWSSSVVILLTGCVLFSRKNNYFRYHLLAENDSRPSYAYILSILVPQIAPVIAKHALYFTLSNFDSEFTLRGYIIIYYIAQSKWESMNDLYIVSSL